MARCLKPLAIGPASSHVWEYFSHYWVHAKRVQFKGYTSLSEVKSRNAHCNLRVHGGKSFHITGNTTSTNTLLRGLGTFWGSSEASLQNPNISQFHDQLKSQFCIVFDNISKDFGLGFTFPPRG